MTAKPDILFEPFELKTLKLANRIVMAPMTRSFSPGGVPNDDVAGYYRRRAEGDVGLILTEGVHPNLTTADGTPNVPNIVTAEAQAGWRNVVDGVHKAGGKIGIQLWHEGPYRNPAKERASGDTLLVRIRFQGSWQGTMVANVGRRD